MSPATRAAPAVLDRARELVTPVLAAAVDRLVPEIRRVVAYHLGWSDVDGRPAGADHGKYVRPALALLSALAVGADAAPGVLGGATVEMVHNFSLLHDDVMDGDRERRHRPTVWAVFGVGPAIIAGDALASLAHEVLLDAPGDHGPAAAAALAAASSRMIAGQAHDMAFESQAVVSVASCSAMEADKTGALLGAASSIGAILAGADPAQVAALNDFGLHLGLAFQAVDDLLGIWGDPARTGKPVASDLRQHKKTLPVTAALAAADGHLGELADLLGQVELSEPELARAIRLIEDCGGRSRAALEARDQLQSALAALDRVTLEPAAVAQLFEVAAFIADREG